MKRTENIGDGLFLVEGINKWALYDLFGQAIRVIDPGTANYLVQIAQSSAEICEKLEYLLRETPEIHGNCVEGGDSRSNVPSGYLRSASETRRPRYRLGGNYGGVQ